MAVKPCSVCARLLVVNAKSRPEPICRPCRAAERSRRYRERHPPTVEQKQKQAARKRQCRQAGPSSGAARTAPCAGCGRLLDGGRGSLPAGQRMCRTCRHANFKPPTRRCGWCAVQFHPRGAGRRFCSLLCNGQYQGDRTSAGHARVGRTCEICGITYRGTYSGQRTCGRACGIALRQQEGSFHSEGGQGPTCPVVYGECSICGAVFIKRYTRKTCSATCAEMQHREYEREYNATQRSRSTERFCPCGALLPARHRHRCDACLLATKKRRKQSERRRIRAHHAGVSREYYTLVEIAERDGHRCGLCRRKVNMAQVVPHPRAPTIDHLIPLDRGGDDTRANVQIAHFLCNSRKGNRGGGEQLALLG